MADDEFQEVPEDYGSEPAVEKPPIIDPVILAQQAQQEPAEPAPTPALDVEAIRQQAIAQYQQEQQALWQQQQRQVPQPGAPVPTIFEQTAQRIFDGDASGALKDFAKQIVDDTETRLRADFDRRLAPLAADRLVTEIAGDLHPEVQNEVRKMVAGVDPSQLAPQGITIIRGFAQNRDREIKQKLEDNKPRMRPEPVGQEAPRVRINTSHFEDMNAERKMVGLPPLSAKDYNDVMTKGPYRDGN
jgi:uncharacterized protein YkwD